MIDALATECYHIAERAEHLMYQWQFNKIGGQEVFADATDSNGLRYAIDIVRTIPNKDIAIVVEFKDNVLSLIHI